MMLLVWRWSLLMWLLKAAPCLLVSSPSLVFTERAPGFAQLEDVEVTGGDLTFSMKFKTGASEGLLLYMREVNTGHHISLSLSDGGLHLQVHPDTLIVPRIEETEEDIRVDDNLWHDVNLGFNDGYFYKVIVFKVDEIIKTAQVSELPLLSNAQYQTFIGGLPPSLSAESEAGYVGCITDIRVRQAERDLQELDISGATVAQCKEEEVSAGDSPPVFTGSLTGVITETDGEGDVILTLQAEDRDNVRPRPILYELLSNPHNYFRLHSSSGQLSLARQLDREALAGAEPSNILTVEVVATELVDGEKGKLRNEIKLNDNKMLEILRSELQLHCLGHHHRQGPHCDSPPKGARLSLWAEEEQDKSKIFVEVKSKLKPKTHQATILGGQFAEVNEFPWAAYLSLRSTESGATGRCGGSLVSDRHVLTAAHCLQQDTPSGDIEFLYDEVTVTLGKY